MTLSAGRDQTSGTLPATAYISASHTRASALRSVRSPGYTLGIDRRPVKRSSLPRRNKAIVLVIRQVERPHWISQLRRLHIDHGIPRRAALDGFYLDRSPKVAWLADGFKLVKPGEIRPPVHSVELPQNVLSDAWPVQHHGSVPRPCYHHRVGDKRPVESEKRCTAKPHVVKREAALERTEYEESGHPPQHNRSDSVSGVGSKPRAAGPGTRVPPPFWDQF